MDFVDKYLSAASLIATSLLDQKGHIKVVIEDLVRLKKWKGRLFIIGVGGSAANSSHAVNDFRKIAGIEAHTPVDNIAEFTAQINDDSWENSFIGCLSRLNLKSKDMLMVLSVGGGNQVDKISMNIVSAIRYAKEKKARVVSIIGKKDNSCAYKESDICIVIPCSGWPELVTPFAESFQVLLIHMFVNADELKEI